MAFILNNGVNPPGLIIPGVDPVAVVVNPGLGSRGRTGAKGDKGDKGDTGTRGPAGTIGPKCSIGNYMVVNVTNIATLLLAANPLRIGFCIENQGDIDLYFGFDNQVLPGNMSGNKRGGLLTKRGGAFSTGTINYTGAIYGICAASNTDVFVAEFLE